MTTTSHQCRICFETEDEMIHPCMCTGSMHHVHRKCLDTWRSSNVNPRAFWECTTCKYSYNIIDENTDIRRLKFLFQLKCAMDIALRCFGVFVLCTCAGMITLSIDDKREIFKAMTHHAPMSNGAVFGIYLFIGMLEVVYLVGFVAFCVWICTPSDTPSNSCTFIYLGDCGDSGGEGAAILGVLLVITAIIFIPLGAFIGMWKFIGAIRLDIEKRRSMYARKLGSRRFIVEDLDTRSAHSVQYTSSSDANIFREYQENTRLLYPL